MSLHIVMTTYCPEPGHPRGGYAVEAADSVYRFLDVPGGISRGFVIANDGPGSQPHVASVRNVFAGKKIEWKVAVASGPRGGIGASLNRAMRFVGEYDQWLYITDDWILVDSYDLTQALKLVLDVGYDYVRLGPPHPNVQCQIRFQENIGWWLELDPSKGGFAFGTRPFIATRAFYDTIGAFKEDCDSYVCERDYADRVHYRSQFEWVKMAEVVSGSLEGPWQHVGAVNVGEHYP